MSLLTMRIWTDLIFCEYQAVMLLLATQLYRKRAVQSVPVQLWSPRFLAG